MKNPFPFRHDTHPDLSRTISEIVAPKPKAQKPAAKTPDPKGDKYGAKPVAESHTRAQLEKLSTTRLRELKKTYEARVLKGDRDAARELATIRGLLRSKGAGHALDEAQEYTALLEEVLLALCEELGLDPQALMEDIQTPEREKQMKAKISHAKKVKKSWADAEKASWKGDRMDYGEYVDGLLDAGEHLYQVKKRDAMEKKSPKLYGKGGKVVAKPKRK